MLTSTSGQQTIVGLAIDVSPGQEQHARLHRPEQQETRISPCSPRHPPPALMLNLFIYFVYLIYVFVYLLLLFIIHNLVMLLLIIIARLQQQQKAPKNYNNTRYYSYTVVLLNYIIVLLNYNIIVYCSWPSWPA